MAQITVTINGRNYRMACEDGQEAHLTSLAHDFDGKVKQLRTSFGEIGDQRLTVMAGVMALDEVFEMKTEIDGLKAELAGLMNAKGTSKANADNLETKLAEEILHVAHFLDELSERLTTTQ